MHKSITLATTAAFLMLAACGSSGTATPAPTSAPKAPAVQATTVPNAAEPTKAPAVAVPTAAAGLAKATVQTSEARDLGELNKGLDTLKSFSMKWNMTWTGKDDKGVNQTGSMNLQQEFISASQDQHLVWSSTSSTTGTAVGKVEFYSIDDTLYMINADAKTAAESCFAMSSADVKANRSFVEPWTFFGDLQNAKLIAKGETVNGVLADHYQVSDKSVAIAASMTGSGDAWVAQSGGYVVKFVGKYQGAFSAAGGLFGALAGGAGANDGTLSWDYAVSDIDRIAKIDPPAGCAKPGTSLPMPPVVTEKTSMAGMTIFKTTDSVENIAKFYKTSMAALGYKTDQDNAFGDTAQLVFKKGTEQVTVILSKDGDATSVMLQELK